MLVKLLLKRWFYLYFLTLTCPAFADAPPPPPADWDQWSADGHYVAHGDVRLDRIFVERVTPTGRQQLWSIAPWLNLHNRILVSDDGNSLVVAPWPAKLSEDVLGQPVLTFYHAGERGKNWTLGDFAKNTDNITRSVSHFSVFKKLVWMNGNLHIITYDDREYVFDEAGVRIN